MTYTETYTHLKIIIFNFWIPLKHFNEIVVKSEISFDRTQTVYLHLLQSCDLNPES